MDYASFKTEVKRVLPRGTILKNPGGGTSTVLSSTDQAVTYRRGSSSINVKFKDLFSAYANFKGGRVSSAELRKFAPSVFDSKGDPPGHSCNCTFLFLVLKDIDAVDSINGSGVRGKPYYVEIAP